MGANDYVAWYEGKRVEVKGDTAYGAQKAAAEALKVPAAKKYKIAVVLAAKNGKPVVHVAVD